MKFRIRAENCRQSWNRISAFTGLIFIFLAASCCLSGCFSFLNPAPSNARHFVLTPLPAASASESTGASLALGVGPVKIPSYLYDTSLAVQKGTNEMFYLPSVLWAERLDVGLQRVLASNLSAMIPAAHIRLTAWRPEEVSVEVYVTIQQFDVDTEGRCTLMAWWRIVSPGGQMTLKAGQTRLARRSSSPEKDPAEVVAALSGLAAEFSRQLAQSIKELTPNQTPGGATK